MVQKRQLSSKGKWNGICLLSYIQRQSFYILQSSTLIGKNHHSLHIFQSELSRTIASRKLLLCMFFEPLPSLPSTRFVCCPCTFDCSFYLSLFFFSTQFTTNHFFNFIREARILRLYNSSNRNKLTRVQLEKLTGKSEFPILINDKPVLFV